MNALTQNYSVRTEDRPECLYITVAERLEVELEVTDDGLSIDIMGSTPPNTTFLRSLSVDFSDLEEPADPEDDLSPLSRAKKLHRISREFYDAEDPVASLRDLLADARHYADANDLDFGNEDRVAYDNYLAEIAEGAAP